MAALPLYEIYIRSMVLTNRSFYQKRRGERESGYPEVGCIAMRGTEPGDHPQGWSLRYVKDRTYENRASCPKAPKKRKSRRERHIWEDHMCIVVRAGEATRVMSRRNVRVVILFNDSRVEENGSR
jgi:ribosomal protein L37AE/L43A